MSSLPIGFRRDPRVIAAKQALDRVCEEFSAWEKTIPLAELVAARIENYPGYVEAENSYRNALEAVSAKGQR